MMVRMIAMVAAVALLVGCERKEAQPDPQTPEEMYELVKRLLQPNVEHDASDFEQAMVWLRRAAEGGLRQAQTDMGGIYLEGGKGGVKPDAREAFYWFSKAADQGSVESLYYMGYILYRGLNGPRDEERAVGLWRRAAEGGVADAQYALGRYLVQADGKAPEGVEWLRKASSAPVGKLAAQAAGALGNIYAKGRPGVPQDMDVAAQWYARAARGGEATAQLVYALMLLQGDHVPQDQRQGMSYLRLAAGQDYPQAIAVLVNLLRNGEQSPESEQEAEAWAARLEKLRTPAAEK